MARPEKAPARFDGAGGIVVATIVAGAIGYLVTVVAARGLGAIDYATFSIFWGALYVLVGSLSGIQQELSRATTRSADGVARSAIVPRFALGVAVVAFVAVLIGGAVVAPWAFGSGGTALILPLAIGLAFNAALVTYSGVTYGLAAWRVVTVVIVLDVLLRLVAVAVALALGSGVTGLAWASVLPFPLVLGFLLFASRRMLPEAVVDVGVGQLAVNVLRTVGAAVGMAVLISGFPLLIGLARRDTDDASVGALIFALILTRAPIVVSVLGLQSYLVVTFRERSVRRVPFVLAAVVVFGGVLALAAWLWGAPVIAAVAGPDFALHGDLLAALVLASIPTACLAISGAVVLSRSRHLAYVVGWTVAAAVAVLLIFVLPGDLAQRTVVALAAGPFIGLLVHVGGAIARQRSDAAP